jgi:heat shock protein HslJ
MTKLEIEFCGRGNQLFRCDLASEEDAAIESDRVQLEKINGQKFPTDPKTDFPSFTLYQDGVEIGGG